MKPANGTSHPTTTVLVAVESPQVREALVAILGALDGFRVIAEVDNDEAAIEAARSQRPQLALVESELSGCGGWWAIRQMQAEQLAGVVVALGRRANSMVTAWPGAHTYVQMGTPTRDLVAALEAAVAVSGTEAERNLLTDAHPVI